MIDLAAFVTPPGGFWPETVTGWVTLFAALAAVIMLPIGYGKWLEKMNGLGGRVKKVEEAQGLAQGAEIERRLAMDHILLHHDQLIEKIGESKKSAEQCIEDAERHTIDLGAKVDEMRTTLTTSTLAISQRLTAVETELRIARGGANP